MVVEFVQKPEVVTAIQWLGAEKSLKELAEALKSANMADTIQVSFSAGGYGYLKVPDAPYEVHIGDYVVITNKVTSYTKEDFLVKYNPVS